MANLDGAFVLTPNALRARPVIPRRREVAAFAAMAFKNCLTRAACSDLAWLGGSTPTAQIKTSLGWTVGGGRRLP
jgi:hypothetical protein